MEHDVEVDVDVDVDIKWVKGVTVGKEDDTTHEIPLEINSSFIISLKNSNLIFINTSNKVDWFWIVKSL